MDNNNSIGSRQIFSGCTTEEVVQRTARLIHDTWPELGTQKRYTEQDTSYLIFDKQDNVEVRIKWSNKTKVHVCVQFTPTQPQIVVASFAALLRKLSGRWIWLSGEHKSPPGIRIFTEVDNMQTGLLYETVFVEHLRELKNFSDSMCPSRPKAYDDAKLRKTYKAFEKVLTPVFPSQRNNVSGVAELADWAQETYELLKSGFPVGISGETSVERQLALTLLAERCLTGNSSLGRLASSSIDPNKLPNLLADAPGFVVIPARALETNISPYERGDVIKNMLHTLIDQRLPCAFEGAYTELQSIFRGGQGAKHDPLNPAVCRIPEIPLVALLHFAFEESARRLKISLPPDMDATVAEVREILQEHHSADRRLVIPVTEYVLRHSGSNNCDIRTFISKLSGHTETFGAIGVHPKVCRSSEVQKRFQDCITSPSFLPSLTDKLYGQEESLTAYVNRLQEEVLTRPLHQPLVIALQGTPGTGKSECLCLTSVFMGIPHIVIDAASIPDPYTGLAQLLGSGKGIVGSYDSGNLEKVAGYHLGALIEVADIDHATPTVRQALGDLFLQIMQNGEAHSSIGTTFSCANLILAFSLNLPGGKDEKAYQRVGFGGKPTMEDVRRDVRKEIKSMVSGAFLSRLGEPILFAPLSEAARTTIVHCALEEAVRTGLSRLGLDNMVMQIEEAVAVELAQEFDSSVITFGARGLVDKARSCATRALLAWHNEGMPGASHPMRLVNDALGDLKFIRDEHASNRIPITT